MVTQHIGNSSAVTPRPRETADMDGNDRAPWLWAIAAGVAHVVFVSGALSTIWSSHFGSMDRLSQRPTDDLPRLLEDAWPWLTALTIVSAFVLGVTAVRRVMRGEWRLVAIRSGVIVFLPVFIEMTSRGVQNGRPDDLNLLPTHSMLMLAAIVLAPLALIAFDLRSLGRPAPD